MLSRWLQLEALTHRSFDVEDSLTVLNLGVVDARGKALGHIVGL